MTELTKTILDLPYAEKHEIFEALQVDLTDGPIPPPILEVLEERKVAYETGSSKAAPAAEVFERLMKKYSNGTDHH